MALDPPQDETSGQPRSNPADPLPKAAPGDEQDLNSLRPRSRRREPCRDRRRFNRAPEHSRFKPGRSGNPLGRRRRRADVLSELREVYIGKVAINLGAKRLHVTRLKALLLKQWERGMKGSERATQAAIANARALELFDQAKEWNNSSSIPSIGSKEFLRRLSDEALNELIRVAQEFDEENNKRN
jgi:uncharacterized protein DUF5681